MKAKPRSIDEYLTGVRPDQRVALAKIRAAVRAAAPRAEECICYGLPAFRLDGRSLVAFGATANHCAFYPMSSATVEAHARELAGHDTSKGTIRFDAAGPPSAALVRKLVKARIAENARRAPSGGAARRGAGGRAGGAARMDESVSAFLRGLDHPLKKEIQAVRKVILGVSPAIREGIRWNAPSFRTQDYFATVHLRSTDRVQIVFHVGAKVKDGTTRGMKVADPAGLIRWLAKERCLVTLGAGREFESRRGALRSIVRAWIRQTPGARTATPPRSRSGAASPDPSSTSSAPSTT